MTEKNLMTSFYAANVFDIASTTYGLTLDGFNEIGVAGSGLVESGQLSHAALLRTAVTVCMIGMYAITKTRQNRWAYSFEKAMAIGNGICWSVNVINIAQIAIHVADHIG